MFRAAEDSSDIINFDNRFDEKKGNILISLGVAGNM